MKLYLPYYYKQFHCIADNCKNNCCSAGWEIDIDDASADFYSKVSGELGKKLHTNIEFNKPRHFKLDKHGSCPFLNNKKLCEIYTTLGEEHLCEICREHPRYYEWFDGIKEGGIGLCCEESARIILSQNERFSTYAVDIPYEDCDEYDEELYAYLHLARNKILDYLDNDEFPLDSRIHNVLWYAYTIQQDIDSDLLDDEDIIDVTSSEVPRLREVLEFFLSLEPNDINWIDYLKNSIDSHSCSLDWMKEFEDNNPEIMNYLKNISIYFVWRYFLKGVFDGEILSKMKFMAVSILIVKFLFYCTWQDTGSLSLDECVSIVRRYSEEVEYSDDNMLAFAEASYDNDFFSVENLLAL